MRQEKTPVFYVYIVKKHLILTPFHYYPLIVQKKFFHPMIAK